MAENETSAKIGVNVDAASALDALTAVAQEPGILKENTAGVGAATETATAAGAEQKKYLETSRVLVAQLNSLMPELQAELDQRKAQQPSLDHEAAVSRQRAADVKAEVGRIQSHLDKARKDDLPGSDLQKKAETAQAQLNSASEEAAQIYFPGTANLPGTMIDNPARAADPAAAPKALAEANQEIASNKKEIETDKRQLAHAQYDAAKAADKSAQDDAAGKANAARVEDLPGDIAQAGKIDFAKKAGDPGKQAGGMPAIDDGLQTAMEAIAALRQQQALGRELQQAVKEATASHSSLLRALKQELQNVGASNALLTQQIQQGHFGAQ